MSKFYFNCSYFDIISSSCKGFFLEVHNRFTGIFFIFFFYTNTSIFHFLTPPKDPCEYQQKVCNEGVNDVDIEEHIEHEGNTCKKKQEDKEKQITGSCSAVAFDMEQDFTNSSQ